MTEQLDFSALWPHWPALLAGLWVTVQLTVMATVGGLAIGIFGAAIRSGRTTWFSRIWGGYVEIIRNTPFVVQLFFIVFGLPNLGLKMTAGEAALLAAVLPNPIRYRADAPSGYVRSRQAWILRQMRQLGGEGFMRNHQLR